MMRRWWVLLFVVFSLSACGGGAVVFAPTPLPPDNSPLTYTHSTGAFSLLVPRQWASYEQLTAPLAVASFAPPNQAPLLSVSVIKLAQALTAEGFNQLVAQYQTQLRPDLRTYNEQDRTAQADGSWRITGVRRVAGERAQSVNTFLRYSGELFAVLEVHVPEDSAQLATLNRLINSFTLQSAANLPVAPASALVQSANAQLEIVNLATWTTPQGVFFITGEVANHTPNIVATLPIRATLLDTNGTPIAEALDQVMGYGIAPEGFAPFSLRFGQGQAGAVTFRLSLGSQDTLSVPALVPASAFSVQDASQQADDGQLFITGQVDSRQSAREALAIASVFDEQGRVIGAGFAPLIPNALSAGASADFTILINELGGTPVQYNVQVQALE